MIFTLVRRLAAMTVFAAAGATSAAAQAPIAVTGVTVIDGTDPNPRVNQTVIIRGDRIASVEGTAGARVPAGARVIDGRGKFLVPGFWDMHVHTAIAGGRPLLSLYVANGVTGVRDMAGDWDTLTTWRRESGFLRICSTTSRSWSTRRPPGPSHARHWRP